VRSRNPGGLRGVSAGKKSYHILQELSHGGGIGRNDRRRRGAAGRRQAVRRDANRARYVPHISMMEKRALPGIHPRPGKISDEALPRRRGRTRTSERLEYWAELPLD
jgi:hypothetical protein